MSRVAWLPLLALAGCSSASETAGRVDASQEMDASKALPPTDAGSADAPGDGPLPYFITSVVSYTPGPCGGYNEDQLPGVVLGPPQGGGNLEGSESVVSLGDDGSIVVSFAPYEIVDGPGTDFIVFENTFVYDGNLRDAEPGEVSVSQDGMNWTTFPCTDTTMNEPDGGWSSTECAGLAPVYSNATNGISPFHVSQAGGDDFDLARIGVSSAKYVRIRSVVTGEACPDGGMDGGKNGFDLDAISIIHGTLD